MKRSNRPATLILLGTLASLPGYAAEPGGSVPGSAAGDTGSSPATTQSAPAQPYGQGTTTTSPSSATTTDGSAPGMGGTTPPGTSPRDGAGAMGRPAVDPSSPPMFKELDADKDGLVTRDEAKRSADTTARFNEMDTNHDGRISAEEWKAAEDRKLGR